jgi:6-pyruvoyltetrahydropterin/6-carboxytetrahydropterin synthase
MEVTVIRRAHFNAAHRLNVREWSEEENARYFGLCNNKNYHGHNYVIEVSITGKVDPISGYVMDMKDLKLIIENEIENRFDHKNLNLDTIEFKDLNPTAENITIVIWNILRSKIDLNYKLKIKLYETERNIVEYSGN